MPVEDLRGRIEAWRGARGDRRRMPEDLWAEAVDWARRYGACRVSRALGIGYASLRARLSVEAGEIAGGTGAQGGGFVELGAWAGSGPTWVEVDRPDGCRLRIQVAPGAGAEAAAVLQAFLGLAG